MSALTELRLTDGRRFCLRPATNEDGEDVATLVSEVLAEYGLKAEPDETDRCVRDIQGNYWDRGGLFNVLIDAEGNLIGCYGLYPHGPGVCELRKMYVRQVARGHGLGRKLMGRALEEARLLGFRRMELDTAVVLKEAIGLYETFGFRDFSNPEMPKRCDRAMFLEL